MRRPSFSGPLHACRDGDHVILLDLAADRYFAIEASEVPGLRQDGSIIWMESGAPASALELRECSGHPVPSVRHGIAFVIAVLKAFALLRMWSLHAIVTRVRRRASAARRGTRPGDMADCRHLVAVFARLRPFFFSSRDRCLFESLALLEFLAAQGHHPSWMFAARARPFAAHCWLQEGDTVLDDSLEHVSDYTPIMRV